MPPAAPTLPAPTGSSPLPVILVLLLPFPVSHPTPFQILAFSVPGFYFSRFPRLYFPDSILLPSAPLPEPLP